MKAQEKEEACFHPGEGRGMVRTVEGPIKELSRAFPCRHQYRLS